MSLDFYRFDASCRDTSIFLKPGDEPTVCPFCTSAHCLEKACHWMAETSQSVVIEVNDD